MSRRRPTRPCRGGFTLVELLLAIVLASVFAAGLYAFFFAGTDAARSHESQARAQAGGRQAIDRFARDARQAISQDEGVTPPVESLTPTSVVLYVDGSRAAAATNAKPDKVRYAIVGSDLIREFSRPIGAAPPYSYGPFVGREVLVEKVANGAIPAFSARTERGVALASTVVGPAARDIAQLTLRLVIGQRTGASNTTIELRSDVALRNAITL